MTRVRYDADLLWALSDREVRARTGLFRVVGVAHVRRALETRARVRALFRARDAPWPPALTKLVDRAERSGVTVRSLESKAWAGPEATGPRPVAAIVEAWNDALPSPHRSQRTFWLGFEAVRHVSNLGSAWRTAVAAGASGVVLIGPSIDPFEPALVRASMGAIFYLRFARVSPCEFRDWRRWSGYQVLGTGSWAARDYRRADYRPPTVLMIGPEHGGLTDGQRRLCDDFVCIPSAGAITSLNLSVATGILAYEVYRQRSPVARHAKAGRSKVR